MRTELHPSSPCYYALHYSPGSSPGFPPVVMADQVMRYADDDDVWLCFLLTPPVTAERPEPWVVWRVPADSVIRYSAHTEAAHAWAAVFS